jgi:hypothetical protein
MWQKVLPRLFSKKPTLWFCILMDLIGCATYFIPALGEWGDTIWAPLSAFVFYQAFGSIGGVLGGAFSFLEEILPFTDIIPTFTIAWYLQQKMIKENPSSGSANQPPIEDAEVIEIK